MLSLIICTRNKAALDTVSQSVASTIGVAYEIIGVDNSQNRYGICEAYNVGAAQAQYSFLCFMHEDIQFHTQDWGKVVANILSDPKVGVLGVAGGTHQPKAPAGWGGAGWSFGRINVMHITDGKSELNHFNPRSKPLIEVATLDGLWLCCRKTVWEEFKFDSTAFSGFHFYDIDFCTRVFTKYMNYLTYDILIEHFSHGTFDKVWMQNAISFFKKRRSFLPFGVDTMTRTETNFIDLKAMQMFTLRVIQNELPKKDVLFCVVECLKLNPLNRDNLYLLKRYLTMK